MAKWLYLCEAIEKIGMCQLKVKLYSIVALSFLLIACGHSSRQAKEILGQAESCMNESPDSALRLLHTIPSPQTLRGKERAAYALLYTQACDKNYLALADDSLIRIAVDYYGKEQSRNAALSYFYLGCVYWNGNDDVAAVDAFLKALHALPPRTADRIRMQIHVYLGECYNREGDYGDAKEHYWSAYQNALCRKDTLDMYYPLHGLGNSSLYLHLNDSALFYYNKALQVSRWAGNAEMEKAVLSSLAGCYELLHQYEKVNRYATRVIEMGGDDLTSMYRVKGNAFVHLGLVDSAYYCLRLSVSSDNLTTRTLGYYSLYQLLKEKQAGELTHYVDSFIVYKDSLNLLERYKEIHRLKEEYAEQTRRQEYVQYQNRVKVYSVVFCVVCFLLGVIAFLGIEKRRKQHYARLQQKLAENKLDNMKKYLSEQFGETVELDVKLKELEEEEVKSCIRSFHQTVWYKKISNLDEQWLSAKEQRELFKDLSTLFADLIETVKGEYPTIKEMDIYFCILSVVGYKLKTVAACLRTNDRNLSTRKSRLKKALSKNTFDFIFVSH